MRRHKTAFFTVLYPIAAPMADAYVQSLAAQTCGDFDLVLVNDGFQDFNSLKARAQSVVEYSFAGLGIAKIREAALKRLWDDGYEAVVFGDFDDWFSPNRIAASVSALQRHPAVFNEVTLVDAAGKVLLERYYSERFKEGSVVGADDLVAGNMLGFSCSAIRRDAWSPPSFPADAIAVDWLFYATQLEKGARAAFVPDAITYYRQHGSNLAGFGAPALTAEAMLRGMGVKAAHYRAMASHAPRFAPMAEKLEQLLARVRVDGDFATKHLELLNSRRPKRPLWWEDVY